MNIMHLTLVCVGHTEANLDSRTLNEALSDQHRINYTLVSIYITVNKH